MQHLVPKQLEMCRHSPRCLAAAKAEIYSWNPLDSPYTCDPRLDRLRSPWERALITASMTMSQGKAEGATAGTGLSSMALPGHLNGGETTQSHPVCGS